MINIEFPVVVLRDLGGTIGYFVIEKCGINNMEHLLGVLPAVMQSSATKKMAVPEGTKFKAFWYGADQWINNTKVRINPSCNGKLLIVVDSNTSIGKSLKYFQDFLDLIATCNPEIESLLHKTVRDQPGWDELIEVKPGIFGFRIDLKMLLKRLLSKLQKRINIGNREHRK